MKAIKRTLTYVFKETALRLRVKWATNIVTLSTGYHVERESRGKVKWENRRCKPNTFHGDSRIPATTINTALEDLETKINNVFYSYEIEDRAPTVDEFKDDIRNYGSKQKVNYNHAFLEFIREGSVAHQWADNTLKSIKQVNNLVLKFEPNISFDMITPEWLEKFVAYQQKSKLSDKKFKNEEAGYSNAVINKNCRVFKWFLKWAKAKGYISLDLSREFNASLKTITKPVIFLTWEELMRVYSYPFKQGSEMDKVRDFFCFCSFTSLRYSDAYALEQKQIANKRISLYTIKTNTSVVIDLNKYSEAIYNKYKGHDKYLLPRITLARLNVLIKRIGELATINENITFSQFYGSKKVLVSEPKYNLLTTHCARRTFICNALSLGITPNVVMQWTGHSEYSAMKPYIDIVDSTKKQEMDKFNTL